SESRSASWRPRRRTGRVARTRRRFWRRRPGKPGTPPSPGPASVLPKTAWLPASPAPDRRTAGRHRTGPSARPNAPAPLESSSRPSTDPPSSLHASTRLDGGLTSPYPQHPAAGVVVGPLELISYGQDLDHEAGPLQVLADGADVPRPLPVEIKKRE